MTQLSPHFSLEELTTTQVRGVDNTPPEAIINRLRDTAIRMEAVRSILGDVPIHVNSGYRSALVNLKVGGSKTSAHMSGYAVDFVAPRFGTPLEVARAIAASKLVYDQLIWEEESWVHIAFGPGLRMEVRTKHKNIDRLVAGLVERGKQV